MKECMEVQANALKVSCDIPNAVNFCVIFYPFSLTQTTLHHVEEPDADSMLSSLSNRYRQCVRFE